MSDQFCFCKKPDLLKADTIKHGYLSEKETKELNFKKGSFFDDFIDIAWIDPWIGV